jgi:hypothetical protein
MVFEESHIKDSPGGLDHYHLWTSIDPSIMYPPPIKEPIFDLTFNLALVQTNLVTANPSAPNNPASDSTIITPRCMFGLSTLVPTDLVTLAAQLQRDSKYQI